MTTPTMRAAVYRAFGGPEVVHIEELPRPTPKPDEVLIRVHASTVSVADYRSRSLDLPKGLGFFGPLALGVFKPRNPVLGMDVAGVVAEVGSKVTRFAVGDEIVGMLGSRFGGHAEYAVMAENSTIAHKPNNMTMDEAVTIIFGGIPALVYLNRADVQPGDEVLVNGGSGSTGTAAIQIATAMGAHVTAVCSARNSELVRSLGAVEVIDYEVSDFVESGPYDVVVDCVGNAPFERVERAIKPGGSLLLIITELRGMLTARRNSRRTGKHVVVITTVKHTAADMEFLVSLAEAGKLRAVTDRTYKLDEIEEAHRYVGEGRKRGNLVLKLS
jgi:NADPH:quinone reductase-like Zn-dependent oxidoreductase